MSVGDVPGRDWTAHSLRTLGEAGYRSSGPRTAVVEALARRRCSVSAAEIADELRRRDAGVGLASIYRALELLDRLKLARRIDVGEGVTRYEPAYPSGEHHHHLVCERCGEVAAFEDAELEHAIQRLSGRMEYAVGGHEVVLRGRCPDCRRPTAS